MQRSGVKTQVAEVGILGLILFICFSHLFVHAAPMGQAQDLGTAPVTNLSNSPDIVSRYADIAADCAGNVHVVWQELDGGEDYVHSVTYSMWDGTSWTSPNAILVAPRVLLPSIAADPQGNLHLVYLSWNDLFYTRTRGGPGWSARSWSVSVLIGNDRGIGNPHWFEMVVDGQGHLHVLFQRFDRFGEPDYYAQVEYITSIDGGESWSQPVILSNPGGKAGWQGTSNWLTIDERGALYVTWQERAIDPFAMIETPGRQDQTDTTSVLVASSLDGGRSRSVPLLMSDPATAIHQPLAIISDGHGTIHLLWHQGHNEIIHRRTSDQGQTWTAPEVILKAQGDITRYGKAGGAVDSRGWVHVVLPLDTQDLYYLVWNGEQWLESVNVTSDPLRTSYWPRLAIAGGNRLHLVWNQGYPELMVPDQSQRLARGEYEVLHKEILLDAPLVKPASCQIGTPVAKATSPPLDDGIVNPTPAATPAATATRVIAPFPAPVTSATNSLVSPILIGIVPSLILIGAVLLGQFMKQR